MSTFVIFIIVLTLGYLLYYAAMITIDLTAKNKSEKSTVETIDTDGEDGDEYEYAPRNVSENTANGGFNISDPDTADVEEALEKISEIDEQPSKEDMPQNNDDDVSSETDNVAGGHYEEESSLEEVDVQPEQQNYGENTNNEDEHLEDATPAEELPEEPEMPEEHDGEEEESSNITMVKYSEEEPAEKQVEEPFDEDKAFDKTLFTPKYDVTEIVAPSMSMEVLKHAIETNAAMSSIVTKANNAMDAHALSEAMRQGSNNKYGIETTDEVQKY